MTILEGRARAAQNIHDPVMLDEVIADLVDQLSRPCCPNVRKALMEEWEKYSLMLAEAKP